MSGKYKLTTFSKVLILILVLALVGGGIFAGISKGVIKTRKGSENNSGSVSGSIETDADGNVINTTKDSEDTINLSLDEWIG